MAAIRHAGDLVRIEYGIFLAVVPAQRVGNPQRDIWILRTMHHEGLRLRVHAGAARVCAQCGADIGLLAVRATTEGN